MRAIGKRARRTLSTLRAALADALRHASFLERRRDHWRDLYRDIESSLTERAHEPGFIAEDEKALVDRITTLEREVEEQRAAADQFRKRACEAETERNAVRAINVGLLRTPVEPLIVAERNAALARIATTARERDEAREERDRLRDVNRIQGQNLERAWDERDEARKDAAKLVGELKAALMERDMVNESLAHALAERDAARSALAEDRAAQAGVVRQEQAA